MSSKNKDKDNHLFGLALSGLVIACVSFVFAVIGMGFAIDSFARINKINEPLSSYGNENNYHKPFNKLLNDDGYSTYKLLNETITNNSLKYKGLYIVDYYTNKFGFDYKVLKKDDGSNKILGGISVSNQNNSFHPMLFNIDINNGIILENTTKIGINTDKPEKLLDINGDIIIREMLNSKNVHINEDLTVKGIINSRIVNIEENLIVEGMINSKFIETNSISLMKINSKNIFIDLSKSTINLNDIIILNNERSMINSNLIVKKDVVFESNINVNGKFTIDNDLSVKKSLYVSKPSYFDNKVTFGENAFFNKTVTIIGEIKSPLLNKIESQYIRINEDIINIQSTANKIFEMKNKILYNDANITLLSTNYNSMNLELSGIKIQLSNISNIVYSNDLKSEIYNSMNLELSGIKIQLSNISNIIYSNDLKSEIYNFTSEFINNKLIEFDVLIKNNNKDINHTDIFTYIKEENDFLINKLDLLDKLILDYANNKSNDESNILADILKSRLSITEERINSITEVLNQCKIKLESLLFSISTLENKTLENNLLDEKLVILENRTNQLENLLSLIDDKINNSIQSFTENLVKYAEIPLIIKYEKYLKNKDVINNMNVLNKTLNNFEYSKYLLQLSLSPTDEVISSKSIIKIDKVNYINSEQVSKIKKQLILHISINNLIVTESKWLSVDLSLLNQYNIDDISKEVEFDHQKGIFVHGNYYISSPFYNPQTKKSYIGIKSDIQYHSNYNNYSLNLYYTFLQI
jgi:cytoskeletal protein CcmA (bactofilin family)